VKRQIKIDVVHGFSYKMLSYGEMIMLDL